MGLPRRTALLWFVLLGACRDGAPPWEPAQFQDDTGAVVRLTYNVKGDHTPAWNHVADSIYFTAWSYPPLPATKGMLLGIARRGGVVNTLLPVLQVGLPVQPWLSALTPAPDGQRVAFFELSDVREHEFDCIECIFPVNEDGDEIFRDTFATNSFLQGALLRVRKPSALGADDATLNVPFAGRTSTGLGSITNIAYPFQRLFEGEGVPIFRASWSPDGTKLVFSDGSQLRVWTIGQPTATVIPGTADGIMPAWSPSGDWIAFSKPFTGTTETITCLGWYDNKPLPAATFRRTMYTPLTREDAALFVVHPDGSGLRSLGEGDGPAWLPDSRSVLAHRDQNLYSIAVETGVAAIVPNTLDGFEPAVSSDGNYVTFVRRTPIATGLDTPETRGQYNVWVVRLRP